MNRFQSVLFFSILALLLPGIQLQAQTEVQARILNPTGYLKPGDPVTVEIQLINPADSGMTITGLSALVHSREYEGHPAGNLEPEPFFLGPLRRLSGSLPLQPGSSLTWSANIDEMSHSAPEQSRMLLKNIHFIFSGTRADGRPLPVLYANNHVVRIASASGTGDESIFSEIDLASEVAGMNDPEITVTLQYPAEINAGEHFNLTARLRNLSDTAINEAGFYYPGTHLNPNSSNLYDHTPCYSDCLLAGKMPLHPKQEILLDLGNFYYDALAFKSGHLRIQYPTLLIEEQSGLQQMLIIDEIIDVMINSSSLPGQTNPEFDTPPVRAALQLTDLHSPGDDLLIHDPNTGNDWVRFAATLRLEDLEARLAPGGEFEGFALASTAQVEALFRNHLFADGHSLNTQRNIRQGRSSAAAESVNRFVQLIGMTLREGTTMIARGYVRDIKYFSNKGYSTAVNIVYNNPRDTRTLREPGLWENLEGEGYDLSSGHIAYWLVRKPSDALQPLPDKGSFLDEALHIPLVNVDDQPLHIVLERLDPVSNRFRLVSAEATDIDTEQPATFNSQTGMLRIPQAALLAPGAENTFYTLLLEYLPASEPPVFLLRALEAAN